MFRASFLKRLYSKVSGYLELTGRRDIADKADSEMQYV